MTKSMSPLPPSLFLLHLPTSPTITPVISSTEEPPRRPLSYQLLLASITRSR